MEIVVVKSRSGWKKARSYYMHVRLSEERKMVCDVVSQRKDGEIEIR